MKKIILSIILLFNFLYGSNKILNYKGDELKNGNGNGIEIHENYIKTGYKIEKLFDFNEEYLKSIAPNRDTLYIGTGLSGKIYRCFGKNKSVLADSIDASVNVIRIFNGSIYAGTSPSGMLYIFNNGKAEKIKTGEYSVNDIKKIDNQIYLATSSEGKIFTYNGKKLKLWHQFNASSVKKLFYSTGLVYAFCSDPAIICALDKHGTVLKSYQLGEDEIADVFMENNYFYISTNSKRGINGIQASIYRLKKDFTSCSKLYESGNPVYSMTSYGDKIIFSIDNRGVICAVYKDKISLHAIKIREIDNLLFNTFLHYGNRLYAISSHKGALYTIMKSDMGFYTTKPIRFPTPVRIAQIIPVSSLYAGFYYRMGNTTLGDSVQSKWKRYDKYQIQQMPPSVYVQIKTDVTKNSKLYGFKLFYDIQNSPPVIDSVILSPPGILYKNGYFPGYNKRPAKEKLSRLKNIGFRIKNSAKDAENRERSIIIYAHNRDYASLLYDVKLKSLFSGKLYELVKGDTSHFMILETEKYPDGKYQLYVSVKTKEGLSASYQTPPFTIDNSSPAVTNYKLSGKTVRFSVTDTTGIYAIEYSVDGSDWKSITLDDTQIYMKKNDIKINVPHYDFIILKLEDVFGNIGYFTIKR